MSLTFYIFAKHASLCIDQLNISEKEETPTHIDTSIKYEYITFLSHEKLQCWKLHSKMKFINPF